MNLQQQRTLIAALSEVNGASFVSIDMTTVPLMNRTIGGKGTPPNPHYGHITKKQIGMSVIIFQNKYTNGYDSMVRRRLEQEGKDPTDFVLGERRWGKRIPNTPMVEHEGDYYLQVIALKPGTTEYLLDGQPIQKSEIIGLRPTVEGEQGGLSRKVIIRCIRFDSIDRIAVNGMNIHLK